MPVDFLSPAQQENYGKYPNDLTPEFIANYFFLDDKDKEWIKSKGGQFSRLGYALQLTTVRYIGTFYSDLTIIPWKIIERIAAQVHVDDISDCLTRYQQSEQRWRHTTEIRTRYGYKEFSEKGIQFKLGRWLYALFWTGTDRPGLLFEQSVSWLLTNKVLLPGITTVERFIAEIRSRMDARLWRSLIKNLTDDQKLKLNKLLIDEPSSLKLLRNAVKSRLPRVDLPEVLLEIAKRTDFISAFTHINEGNARAADLEISICAVLLAQACNTGLEPFVREDILALKRDRLIWVDQNYIRDETIRASNAIIVAAQNQNKLAKKWGGGDVASADGMRFVVPVRSIHSAPNPKYFNRRRGVTWYNLLSNQRAGLNHVTVPGILRDSLILLGVVLEQQTELQPTRIMTDTGAYSDVVFGLFRLLGHRFSPRLADLGDVNLNL